ncbi:MAG TPA: prephenate dehydrogenase [Phycisphaerae bacterium]|nr:prephenate dehydrogenase [Phycisphaerae bacterium]
MTRWNQVTIIGTGLIGGSLGLALKQRRLAKRVVGVGHRQSTLDDVLFRGAADEVTLDACEGVRGSDLVVLGTAVGLFEETAERIGGNLEPGAVVIDVGSTKARVVRTLEPLMPKGRTFVGCHPIAGSEKRGIAYARPDLFEGATCVVTPTDRTPADVLVRVVSTWQDLGMMVRQMAPEVHDRLLAEVSHLPHVVASVLVRAISEEAKPLVGPGWADTTRVASGDAVLWRDILLSNADEIAAAIGRFQDTLADLCDAVSQRDSDRIESLLAEAKDRRDRLIESPRPNNEQAR